MLKNHSEYLNDKVKSIISSWSFFNDLRSLAFVLKPLCKMILALEKRTANLSDYYFGLVRISAAMKKLPQAINNGFRVHYIKANNERFHEFNEDIYLLVFFLDPFYRGKFFFF